MKYPRPLYRMLNRRRQNRARLIFHQLSLLKAGKGNTVILLSDMKFRFPILKQLEKKRVRLPQLAATSSLLICVYPL